MRCKTKNSLKRRIFLNFSCRSILLERDHKVFSTKIKVYGFCDFVSGFQNWCSLWKLLSQFSRNTLIPSWKKTWSLNIFLEAKLSNKFKNGFQTFLILHIWDIIEVQTRFQKQFWKLDVKYLMVSFRSHSIWAFSVLLEDSLRIISKSWRAAKNPRTQS
jgi:hypothetical protein